MGSGNTVPVGFTVVGVALPTGVTQQSATIDVQVSNGSSISESTVSILVTSTGGLPCIINCNNNDSGGPPLTEIIAIVLVVISCWRRNRRGNETEERISVQATLSLQETLICIIASVLHRSNSRFASGNSPRSHRADFKSLRDLRTTKNYWSTVQEITVKGNVFSLILVCC